MAVDENRLRAEGLYECREPVGNLTADLDQIQSMAAGWHHSRKQRGIWTTVLWIVGVICFMTGALWWLGIILFAAGGWLLHDMKSYPKAVANHEERCTFGRSMTAMLAADTDPTEPIAIRVAFDAKEETISEGALLGRNNGKQRLYKVSWFSVQANLHDGTTFSETIDDLVRRRSFTNARGKSKVKVRTNNVIAMRFDYPSEAYGDMTPFRPKMEQEIQLPPGTIVRAVEISPKAIKVKALATQSGSATYLAQASSMLALGVYRILNLSREIEARKRAQAGQGGRP
ncbi:MAG TPA: hypothetical protein VKU19_33180 [Bryobacteraceae bacterium]|nr:hypothetical protein [Bryobacteraceae bacterium]